jgi:hypothetical protein
MVVHVELRRNESSRSRLYERRPDVLRLEFNEAECVSLDKDELRKRRHNPNNSKDRPTN